MSFYELFDGLYHDFETGDYHPDSDDKSWFIDMKCPECEHEESTNRDKDSLSEACIHGSYIDITTIVDFFGKKYKECKKT